MSVNKVLGLFGLIIVLPLSAVAQNNAALPSVGNGPLRREAGGHIELQALRYAAMVSTLTFKRAVEIHQQYSAAQPYPTSRNYVVREY